MRVSIYKFLLVLSVVLTSSTSMVAQFRIDMEAGIVQTGYNDVRLPGETGSPISLKDDLGGSPSFFYRFRVGYLINEKHLITALYAPLSLYYSGNINRDVNYGDKLFQANSDVEAKYMFNSYRLTYQYMMVNNDKWKFGYGLTIKIRDAIIELKSGDKVAGLSNVGPVPIINFHLSYSISETLAAVLKGDALGAPGIPGRAEDISMTINYIKSDNLSIRAGYRFLEGGSGGTNVYTYALIHYGLIGVQYKF